MYVIGALFDGPLALVPLAGAVVTAALLGWLAARRLAHLEVVALVGVAGGLAYGTTLALGRVGDLLGASRHGWAELLGAAIPAQPTTGLLTPPGAVLWVTAFVAVVLALRARGALTPMAPPLLAFVVMLVLVGGAGDLGARARVLATGALAVTLLAAAALRAALPAGGRPGPATRRGRRVEPTAVQAVAVVAAGGPAGPAGPADGPRAQARRRVGALAVGLPIVAVIAALGTATGAVIPFAGDDRFDPRDHWHPPVDGVELLNPLVRVRSQLETEPVQNLLTIRMTSDTGTVPDRIRIAALGEFDGASWRDDGRFLRIDRTLPAADPPPGTSTVEQALVRAEVTVGDLTGVLLPSVGQPTFLDYDLAPAPAGGRDRPEGIGFQPASGALAILSNVQKGDHYRFEATFPAPTEDELGEAGPATGPAAAPYLGLPPGLPPALLEIAGKVTGDARTPYDKLVALETFLRDDTQFPYDLSAAPGHSYGVLSRMLTGAEPADHRSYAEQRAAAFAVLARAEGFATRISVGYLLFESSRAGADTFTITTRQAHAWPEVLLDGIGWVAFEPTDVTQLTRTLPPPAGPLTPTGGAEQGKLAEPERVQPIIVPRLDDSPDTARDGGSGGNAALRWPFVVLYVVLAVLIGLPALVVLEKRRRRGRRHRGGPVAQVDGAWREARDRLAEHGVSRSKALTQREIVTIVAGAGPLSAAAGPLAELAAMTDHAMYAPAASNGLDPARAWLLVDQVRAGLRAAEGFGGRARARLDPRPLLPAPRLTPGAAPAAGVSPSAMRATAQAVSAARASAAPRAPAA
ncbi:transglutaminase domain-containing protein [Frankia sp. CN7]|uniref:transglutaminase-like domain-containing protein n=1 Tax=Frankia nepalensis TaxID=1836974 RepID=UPI0019320C7D|nr:transglutaminase-like domain-containing protein [Frankia nepalensis]MBL7497069.1 transglutaminase domain-containing protein [Frankia nepalensis]